ncbi:trehalose-phosphatase [Pseudactinotalea sp. Z1748]|uniref:trehalose-phosphatase n=1 Tax=Pseudactinotalea sp. Z1748 TaxID=3413027 RepID=UPI003C7E2F64
MTAPHPPDAGNDSATSAAAPTPSSELDEHLATFARAEHILVALDFDGVLAPLVPDPSRSRPIPRAAEALVRLSEADGVQLALVSGRPAADLAGLATPPAGTWLVGSHGAQTGQVEPDGTVQMLPFELEPSARELLTRVTDALERIAAEPEFDGAWVERKPASAALHTRPVADAEAARRALAFALAGPGSWPGTYAQPGNQVVEIPVVHATKGEAVATLRHRLRVERDGEDVAVLFAGDDVTDETALAILGEGDLGVKVGTAESVATVRVADEEAMAALLHALVDLREQ